MIPHQKIDQRDMIMLQHTDAVFDIKPDPCNLIVFMIFIRINGRIRLYFLTIDIVDCIESELLSKSLKLSKFIKYASNIIFNC